MKSMRAKQGHTHSLFWQLSAGVCDVRDNIPLSFPLCFEFKGFDSCKLFAMGVRLCLNKR